MGYYTILCESHSSFVHPPSLKEELVERKSWMWFFVVSLVVVCYHSSVAATLRRGGMDCNEPPWSMLWWLFFIKKRSTPSNTAVKKSPRAPQTSTPGTECGTRALSPPFSGLGNSAGKIYKVRPHPATPWRTNHCLGMGGRQDATFLFWASHFFKIKKTSCYHTPLVRVQWAVSKTVSECTLK